MDNGWLKVQGMRLNPSLDEYSSTYSDIKFNEETGSIYSQAVITALELAGSQKIKLVKIYSGDSDKQLLLTAINTINNSQYAKKLNIKADKKGPWFEITLN